MPELQLSPPHAAEGRPGAIFLDRDGVINRRRLDHVKSWKEFQFLPGVLPALAELRNANVPVVIVTNQSVVGRGLLAEERLLGIHDRMLRSIAAAGGRITAIYACLHAPIDACDCRKPKPALLERASRELGLDLSRSIMVGDSATDVQAARAAGCRPVLVNNVGVPLDADVIGVSGLPEAVMLWRNLRVPEAALPC